MDVIRHKVNGASVEANGYFVKPVDVDVFFALTKELRSCYLNASQA